MESLKIPVYCHMTDDLGACAGGGWTLVVKMNGSKVQGIASSLLFNSNQTTATYSVYLSFFHPSAICS